MTFLPTKDQFSGCLVGQCLGDALGFPVEGWPADTCGPYAEELRTFAKEALGSEQLRFGQYTDDSQLAREWMQSYAAVGRFDPQDYAARIRDIFALDRIVGRGMATDQAARKLIQGIPWQQSGMPAPYAGNGTAMRAGPVGLVYGGNPAELIRVAHEQGYITHQDPRCSAGSVAIAGAVALAAQTREVDVAAFARQLSEWMRPAHALFADEVLRLTEWVQLPLSEAAPIIACAGAPDFTDQWKWISPYVVPSALWSLYSFLRTPEDYWETVCTAIECGGDVDTTAAMAGAISGAHVGLERLPADLARRVNDRGTWGYDELVALAHRCHAIAAA